MEEVGALLHAGICLAGGPHAIHPFHMTSSLFLRVQTGKAWNQVFQRKLVPDLLILPPIPGSWNEFVEGLCVILSKDLWK